jgi:hypothetical protein
LIAPLAGEKLRQVCTIDLAHSTKHEFILTGTALHQRTRAAIKKRAPIIKKLIIKHNEVRRTLISLLDSGDTFHVPPEIPSDLSKLRAEDSLLEEVYFAEAGKPVPRWVKEQGVRDGIRAMLLVQRCIEEQKRLVREERNLRSWVARQSAAVRECAASGQSEWCTITVSSSLC